MTENTIIGSYQKRRIPNGVRLFVFYMIGEMKCVFIFSVRQPLLSACR